MQWKAKVYRNKGKVILTLELLYNLVLFCKYEQFSVSDQFINSTSFLPHNFACSLSFYFFQLVNLLLLGIVSKLQFWHFVCLNFL